MSGQPYHSVRMLATSRVRIASLLAAILLLAAQVAPATAQSLSTSYVFVSPNTEENLTLEQAKERMRSPEEDELLSQARYLFCRVGREGTVRRALGSWRDGAEHSLILRFQSEAPELEYAAAWLGRLARQKSVLHFRQEAGGKARLYVMFAGRAKLKTVVRVLEESGIVFRTLVPRGAEVVVYIVDAEQNLLPQTQAAAKRLRAQMMIVSGSAAYLGDQTDRQRAQQVFAPIVADYERSHPEMERRKCAVSSLATRK